MAGYWPSSFFGVFMDRDEVVDRTSFFNKGFIIWPKDYTKEFSFCGNKAGNPERAR